MFVSLQKENHKAQRQYGAWMRAKGRAKGPTFATVKFEDKGTRSSSASIFQKNQEGDNGELMDIPITYSSAKDQGTPNISK